MLEAALIALALLCVALGIACHGLYRNQQRMLAEQAKCDAVRDARIKELGKRLDAYLTGSIRMGEELHELRRVVAPLPDKLSQIEQRDPSSLSFTQAARLVGMGASVEDLTQSCGLSQAEAELISRLHQSKAQ
ncbi:DUF2802 domain-containing protein [Pseudomonas sp. NPDC077649]|uniref:DUF2802 domain-containing protein n=1 Tax=unclassified Pseudomonas TaxID=196821 RepID=UPI0003960F78|nr:DUF2802 domain-containing protein [Pseudomonas sp. EGD-AK9]ERI50971.1 chemotaxis protein [Pseudomonas sp. EGD-AK9]